MNKLRGLILDVDGVIVGGKKGYNWPHPHPEVIRALYSLRKRGTVVSLCTGKGSFAIKDIITAAHLDNVHIGDGGAVVRDFIHDRIIETYPIAREAVRNLVAMFEGAGIYTELYTIDGYYVQKDAVCGVTEKHTAILSRKPEIVPSLLAIADTADIIKCMPVADGESGKSTVTDLFAPYRGILTLQWGLHPTASPYHFGIITRKGTSKRQAALAISGYTDIPLAEFLGVGDGMTDWQFMEICGWAGAMGNSPQELKDKVCTKGANGFVGPHVDENGLLDILRYFKVILN